MLLRLADIKRRSPSFFLNAIKLFYFVTLVPFGLTIGLGDPLKLLELAAGAVVSQSIKGRS